MFNICYELLWDEFLRINIMVIVYEVCILVRKSGRMIRFNRVLDSFDFLR